MPFRDRSAAGRRLAAVLSRRELHSPVVLGIPRGGIAVALEVALELRATLEVFVARKIGAPDRAELGIGGIAEGGAVVVDRRAVQALGLPGDALERLIDAEKRELDRRVEHYRGDRPLPELEGRDVVLVDDGLATGVTAEAALQALRDHSPRLLVLAVPVCAPATAERLSHVADEVLCAEEPTSFCAVGQFYDRFDQTSDDEVLELLARASGRAEART